jgi:hypothetical protein
MESVRTMRNIKLTEIFGRIARQKFPIIAATALVGMTCQKLNMSLGASVCVVLSVQTALLLLAL